MLGRLGYEFYLKEPDKEVGRSRDTGGPKRCGMFVLMLSKELRERVEVADDDVSACLMVKGVRRDRQRSYQS